MAAASSDPALGVQELKAPCSRQCSINPFVNHGCDATRITFRSSQSSLIFTHVLYPALKEIMQTLLCECEMYLEQRWNFDFSWGEKANGL